jgi:hypothetical protein
MESQTQNVTRRAIQRWEGEGGAIAEGPQQAPANESPRGTNSAKRSVNLAKGDGRERRHSAN